MARSSGALPRLALASALLALAPRAARAQVSDSPSASPSTSATPSRTPCGNFQSAYWGIATPLGPWTQVVVKVGGLMDSITFYALGGPTTQMGSSTGGGAQPAITCGGNGNYVTAFAYTLTSTNIYPATSSMQSVGPWSCSNGSTVSTVFSVAQPAGTSVSLSAALSAVCPTVTPSQTAAATMSASVTASTKSLQ